MLSHPIQSWSDDIDEDLLMLIASRRHICEGYTQQGWQLFESVTNRKHLTRVTAHYFLCSAVNIWYVRTQAEPKQH